MSRILKVDHFLSDLLAQSLDLAADLIYSSVEIIATLLSRRGCGSNSRTWRGEKGRVNLQPLGQFSDLIHSALGETQPDRSKIEHSDVLIPILLLLHPACSWCRLTTTRGCLSVCRGLGLVLTSRKTQTQAKDHRAGISRRGLRLGFLSNWTATCRANLLSLQPTLETAKVEDVTTRQFLRPAALDLGRIFGVPRPHFLATDNAGIFAAKIFGGGIRVLLHMLKSLTVPDKRVKPLEKRSRGHEPVSHNMDGQAVEGDEDREERGVNAEFDEI
jgi:hypothetical protein